MVKSFVDGLTGTDVPAAQINLLIQNHSKEVVDNLALDGRNLGPTMTLFKLAKEPIQDNSLTLYRNDDPQFIIDPLNVIPVIVYDHTTGLPAIPANQAGLDAGGNVLRLAELFDSTTEYIIAQYYAVDLNAIETDVLFKLGIHNRITKEDRSNVKITRMSHIDMLVAKGKIAQSQLSTGSEVEVQTATRESLGRTFGIRGTDGNSW